MVSEPGHAYGLSKNLFVSRKASGDSIVIGGIAEDASRWTRVLSQRAAQMLWFNLTQLLYPDQSGKVNAMITTAPLRGTDLPTITTHTTVDQLDQNSYEVTGWVGNHNWTLRLEHQEALSFWSALDSALTPASTPPASSQPPASG